MPLEKELWVDMLIGDREEFFSDDEFLADGVDMSYAVDKNEHIHFAYKGPRPNVTKNPTYPLTKFKRTDIPESVKIDAYATDVIEVPAIDVHALPYDKKQSLLEDSRLALRAEIASEGIWAVAPADNSSSQTPVVNTSGTTVDGNGYKLIVKEDLKALRTELDLKYPGLKNMQWVLLLDPASYWGLVNDDPNLQIQFAINDMRGSVGSNQPLTNYYNFRIRCEGRTPWYSSTGTKLPYGATPTIGLDLPSATAYVSNKSFCTGLGSTDMFNQDNEPCYQADFASFLQHAYVGPWGMDPTKYKHMGAIIRTTA